MSRLRRLIEPMFSDPTQYRASIAPCACLSFVLPIMLIFLFFMGRNLLHISSGKDGFADHLTIPTDIIVTETEPTHYGTPLAGLADPSTNDEFQRRMMEALKSPGSPDPTIKADIPSIYDLHKHHPQILERYLACSPAWRVFKEDGQRYATRRWIVGPHWHYELNGYYSNFDVGFQCRTTIGLSGKPRAEDPQYLSPGETQKLQLKFKNNRNESYCAIKQDDLIVEVYEESKTPERRLTKAAIAHMEVEFHKLLVSPNWSTIEDSVMPIMSPPEKSTFILWNGREPGIYEAEIWVNPGEAGRIYLKAYEVTNNTRLSENQLMDYSNEWIGWSSDSKQLFLSNTQFKIDEGDWGKPYAARFEVWFVPDSGGEERMLMQRIFKIEGWQS